MQRRQEGSRTPEKTSGTHCSVARVTEASASTSRASPHNLKATGFLVVTADSKLSRLLSNTFLTEIASFELLTSGNMGVSLLPISSSFQEVVRARKRIGSLLASAILTLQRFNHFFASSRSTSEWTVVPASGCTRCPNDLVTRVCLGLLVFATAKELTQLEQWR